MFEKSKIDNKYKNSIRIADDVATLGNKVVVSSLFEFDVFDGVLFSNRYFSSQKSKFFINEN